MLGSVVPIVCCLDCCTRRLRLYRRLSGLRM